MASLLTTASAETYATRRREHVLATKNNARLLSHRWTVLIAFGLVLTRDTPRVILKLKLQ